MPLEFLVVHSDSEAAATTNQTEDSGCDDIGYRITSATQVVVTARPKADITPQPTANRITYDSIGGLASQVRTAF